MVGHVTDTVTDHYPHQYERARAAVEKLEGIHPRFVDSFVDVTARPEAKLLQ
jgi:hypothetical protein